MTHDYTTFLHVDDSDETDEDDFEMQYCNCDFCLAINKEHCESASLITGCDDNDDDDDDDDDVVDDDYVCNNTVDGGSIIYKQV